MLKFARLAALAMAGLLASGLAFAGDVTVNGVTIPQSRIDLRVNYAAHKGQPVSPELRKAITEQLINLELMSQEATKKGLDKDPDTAQELELARQSTLANAYIKDYTKNHPISQDELKQEYENLKSRLGDKQYKIADILVGSEKEAAAIVRQLKKGANFNKLAKKKSMDPAASKTGGEVGWFTPPDLPAPLAEAMLALKKGHISAPVQTQRGWHIIKLENVRKLKLPPLEKLKPGLLQNMQQQQIQKALADLRANAKVEE